MTGGAGGRVGDVIGSKLDVQALRGLLGRFATGVTVILVPEGSTFHGMTANAFTAVSLEPPLVSVCIDKGNDTHALVERAGCFTVNILAEDQVELSNRFAGRFPGTDRMEGIRLVRLPSDNAVLPGSLGWLDCEVAAAYPGGDHTIFVAEVKSGSIGREAEPLLFYASCYRQLLPERPEPPGSPRGSSRARPEVTSNSRDLKRDRPPSTLGRETAARTSRP